MVPSGEQSDASFSYKSEEFVHPLNSHLEEENMFVEPRENPWLINSSNNQQISHFIDYSTTNSLVNISINKQKVAT